MSVRRASENWPEFPVEPDLEELYGELVVWIDALKNPPRQLGNDCRSERNRHVSMAAIQTATDQYNQALARLVEAVYGKAAT